MLKNVGPGVLVAAAFIGPGTITVCTVAGVGFGYALLWAMLLSILATMVLQEMAARIGIVTQKGLPDIIKTQLGKPWLQKTVLLLVLLAIVFGNSAYEAGNIGGATLGMEALLGSRFSHLYPLAIGVIAFTLLYLGNYKLLERSLVGLVIIMSLSFLATAVLTRPNVLEIVKGFVPKVPHDGLFTIIALVGTTVVPYNLFLHASLVAEKWKTEKDLKLARTDTYLSIALGGLVSMGIMIAATAIPGKEVTGVMDLAKGLEPLYGRFAGYFIGIGLVAAGVTSAITAPLAAAYVARGCFGWETNMKDIKFRAVWLLVLALGVLFLSLDITPLQMIKMAQVANGMLLPVIAILLVWLVNKKAVLGQHTNSTIQNVWGIFIVLLSLLLGLKGILSVFGPT